MATERKPYCRIETSLLREPWPDDLKLALVKLVMFMCDRWARDRLTTDEAIRATLSRAQVAEISGKHRPDVASTLLQRLADVASISIELRGDFTSIYWPKLAETQGWASRDRAISDRKRPQSAPAPAPAPAPAQKKGQEKAASPPTRARSSRPKKNLCPETPSPEQWQQILEWRKKKHLEFTDDHLKKQWSLLHAHHGGVGNRRENWLLSFYYWLTNDIGKPQGVSTARPSPREYKPGQEKPPPQMTDEQIAAMEEEHMADLESAGLGRH